MSVTTKIVTASVFSAMLASVAVAQSGPVDSKGQAGSVQQFGNTVTQGTNAEDAARSRAAMDPSGTGGQQPTNEDMTTGSVASPEAADPPESTRDVGSTGPQPGAR